MSPARRAWALLGRPLAQPSRRLLAMGADLAAIGIVSSLSNVWLLAACALGVFEQARARRQRPPARRLLVVDGLVSLMAVAGLRELVDALSGPAPVRAAAADDELAALAVPAVTPAASDPVTTLQAEVRRLTRQLARERSAAEEAAAAEHWRERLRRLGPGLEFGIGYGWSLVYFTMLPVWWRGQTLGKRLFGLRVVEITGKPMTPLLGFKRFGGYLAGIATGGLGLLQLLWDANRQALQDKAAHTVVIDKRGLPRPQPGPEPTTA